MEMIVTGGVQGCTNEHLSQVVYKSVPMEMIVTGGVQGCTNEDTCHRWCTRVYLWR